MRIDQACDEFIRGYFSTHERSEKTKAAYLSDITQFRHFVGDELKIFLIKGSHVEKWASNLQEKGYSSASIRRKIVVLKVFCSYWVQRGIMVESPFWRVKISYGRITQLPNYLTEMEILSILKQAKHEYSASRRENSYFDNLKKPSSQEYRKLRNLSLIELLFATGMRVGEVASIDIKDFYPEEFLFRIRGKGGRHRLAFIVDKDVLRILVIYLKARVKIKTRNSALFLNAAGDRLTTQGIALIITQLRENGGIKRNVTPHMLRHTVATLLLRNGADIRVVQEFLGHASIVTTQRYVHIVKEHLIQVLQNHHPSIELRKSFK